ncbi:MAG: hypothetical protein ACFB6S_19965 [Geminicoccaceae bacterium]
MKRALFAIASVVFVTASVAGQANAQGCSMSGKLYTVANPKDTGHKPGTPAALMSGGKVCLDGKEVVRRSKVGLKPVNSDVMSRECGAVIAGAEAFSGAANRGNGC